MEKQLLQEWLLGAGDNQRHQPHRAQRRQQQQRQRPIPQLHGERAHRQPARRPHIERHKEEPGQPVEGRHHRPQRQPRAPDRGQPVAVCPERRKAEKRHDRGQRHLHADAARQVAPGVTRQFRPDQRKERQRHPAEVHQVAVSVAHGAVILRPRREAVHHAKAHQHTRPRCQHQRRHGYHQKPMCLSRRHRALPLPTHQYIAESDVRRYIAVILRPAAPLPVRRFNNSKH
jgi:hypothetical protein